METKDAIYFFKPNNSLGWLSNFYYSDFEENGIVFNCNEKYFMYHKALVFDPNNHILIQNILNEKNPNSIKKYGRQVRNFDDTIWNDIKFNIMVDGLRLKFNQNKRLKELLKQTNKKMLYEASPYDSIWGIGFDFRNALQTNPENFGENLLGKALIIVRDEIMEE